MNFFNRSRTRTPVESVRALRENIGRLGTAMSAEQKKRVTEENSRLIATVKACLCGEGDVDSTPETVTAVANEVYNQDLLSQLVTNLPRLEFEARKDVGHIYNTLLRRQIGTRLPTVELIVNKPDIIFNTLKGYADADIALNTGMILKEMLRYEPLAKILLHSEQFYTFPKYIEDTTFGISCDAFANMKETLTKHKTMVATYLERNYDRFFNMYNTLIMSNNYVTKRQSLKLLGEILLDRANYSIMTKYIASEANLKLMMNFLRDRSRNIQFEAFHVFKVFVANPNKPPEIARILRRNKDRLLVFLKDFHNDKDDDQFNDEKQFLITQIERL
ncbi:calcium-binding protein 39 family protein [Vanrija pseudolonga]|uniref:Calcium-binding protein 39-like n=1 Tax=Vanrija pseudolonga TaxID=143232 RepID=A0AAF0Y8R4_9TREE|nr:Calcium-binding protein 39-like [Vanrija pseudolonga]